MNGSVQQILVTYKTMPNSKLTLHNSYNPTTPKMTQLCRKIAHLNIRWNFTQSTAAVFGDFFRFLWDRFFVCSCGKSNNYRRLSSRPSSPVKVDTDSDADPDEPTTTLSGYETDSDLVALKISVLGDCQIGKTSFLIKYVGDEEDNSFLKLKGLNLMDKTFFVRGARIVFSIWDVGGDTKSVDHIPAACKDAVAILFMFDLTSRCTLNSVINWHTQARKWNKSAIPILIGTKFDDFVRLPPDLQWTIVTQARAYAKAMKGTVFFSSAKHNINVNKIFKFIFTKLFNLPASVHRNLNLGEPTIDF